jgi:hypothetical protein
MYFWHDIIIFKPADCLSTAGYALVVQNYERLKLQLLWFVFAICRSSVVHGIVRLISLSLVILTWGQWPFADVSRVF